MDGTLAEWKAAKEPEDLYEKDYFLSAPDDPPGRPDAYGVSSDFMFRRSLTIYGGSNEVQRNIIAGTLLRK